MRELTKEERKLYNAQVRKRNEGLQQSSLIFGMLTAIFFFSAAVVPVSLTVYFVGAALICGILKYITSKLAE